MASYLRRYLAGEHQAVWAELRALGDLPGDLAEDAAAVARETMRRVTRHVVRLTDALDALGFVPASPDIPPHAPPTDADLADVDWLRAQIGELPAAFVACLREVGAVSFMGDCPALELSYNSPDVPSADLPPGLGLPDPLAIVPVDLLCDRWEDYRADIEDDDPYAFYAPFAPDEYHKANISGGTHDLLLPDRRADPPLHGVAGRPDVTLVEYLRSSISWGGFPGWSFVPRRAPDALAPLRVTPDF